MNFQLSKEQEKVRELVRKFALAEVEPIAADIDKEHRFPKENVEKMAKLGMMGIPFPAEYGGAGSDHISYAITVEELARVCASTAVIVSAHTSLCCWPIFNYGTDEQKAKYAEMKEKDKEAWKDGMNKWGGPGPGMRPGGMPPRGGHRGGHGGHGGFDGGNMGGDFEK